MRSPDLLKLSGVLGLIFMRLSGLSWRVRYVRPLSGRSGSIRNRPALFVLWHGRQLPLIHSHRNENVRVLVSLNTDGQYVTNVLHSMGFRTVRGSSSRGGMEAIREMTALLRNGIDCAITPDGPRGPAEKAKSGISHISRLGRLHVVPMGTSAWPAIRFKSWDRFILPLPFARIPVVEGRPVPPMKKGDDQQLWTEVVETELYRVTAFADLLASPGSMFISRILGILGKCLSPLLFAALALRSAPERQERKGLVQRQKRRPVWMHGSSLGELNGLLPYAEYLKKKGIPVWITCFTPSGRAFIERMELDGSYIPLDTQYYTERFIRRLKPIALILAETEIWPSLIFKTLESSIPCMMINARISAGSIRGYRLLGSLPRRLLSCFTGILARSESDRERFLQMGVDERIISVSGDSKILTDHGDPPDHWRAALKTDRPVLVAGSTRKGEESIVLRAAEEADYFPVIVPRHLHRTDEVRDLMISMGFSPVYWSKLLSVSFDESLDFDSIIVDVHGVLARMYGIGDAAFVGGTFVPVGGHNVLEPPMRGIPFIVGPDYGSFTEIVEILSESNVSHVASSHAELADILINLRSNPPQREDVIIEFEKIKGSMLDDFAALLERTGIIEMRKTDEET